MGRRLVLVCRPVAVSRDGLLLAESGRPANRSRPGATAAFRSAIPVCRSGHRTLALNL
jgi:hypothetical protein